MPWVRAMAIAGTATAFAVGGVAACGAPATSSTNSAQTALGASNPAPTLPPTAAPTLPPTPVVSSAPSSRIVVAVKHPTRVPPTLSVLDPASTIVATASRRVAAYASPNGDLLRHFSARTALGAARTFLVTGTQRLGWLQVELPIRPNGSRGWIRSSAVSTATTPMAIDVDRRAHVLTLLRGGVA